METGAVQGGAMVNCTHSINQSMAALRRKATVLPKNVSESDPTSSRYPSLIIDWLNPRFHFEKEDAFALKTRYEVLFFVFDTVQEQIFFIVENWDYYLNFVPVADWNLPCRATLTFFRCFSRPFEQHFHAECRHDVEVAGAGRLGLRHCQW